MGRRRVSTVESGFQRERERERDQIHITFITGHCEDCSILLAVIAVDLILCLIYKLHFMRGVCV